MTFRTVIFSFLLIIIGTNMNAQTNIKNEVHYKNMTRYLNEAMDLIAVGDLNTGTKKLNYAKKSADKLIAQGYETEITEELAQIKNCETKLTNPSSDVKIIKTETANDIGSTTRNLSRQVKTIREIFAYNPSNIEMQLTDMQKSFAKNFSRTAFSEKCKALKAMPETSEPRNKRYINELEEVENFVGDLDASASTAGVFAKIDDMIQRMQKYKSNAEAFQLNTGVYIETLMLLMPENQQLKQQYETLLKTGDAIASEKSAAARKAEAEKKAKEEALKTAEKEFDRLPEAGMNDAALEAEFKRLGQAAIGNSFVIDRIIITASRWGVNKDMSGRPLNRSMVCCAVGKDKTGQCCKQTMLFTQNYVNGNYGSAYYDSGWTYPKSIISCP